MKPRPFYRWKSFWLGLCVLVFLGWAWRASFYNSSSIRYARVGDLFEAVHIGGQLLLMHRSNFHGVRHAEWHWEQREVTEGNSVGGLRSYWERQRGAARYWSVHDWLLFFPSLAVWCAWLFWHWKREQKKAAFS